MQVLAFRSLRRSRLLSTLLGVGILAASTAIAPPASAVVSGIDGNTNKPISGVGHRCGDCYSGGAAPQVAFAGPASLNSGQTGQYTLTVTTNSTRVGAAVAVTPDANDGSSGPVTLIPGNNTAQKFNEVVHASPPPASAGGKAVFSFSFVAPQYGGTVKLWGVGLATNKNGKTSDDADALTTMTVNVVGPSQGGDAGAKDSGFVPTDSGTSDSGTLPGTDSGTVPGTDGGKLGVDGSTDEEPGGIPASGDGGCSIGVVGASSTDAGALGAALFTMIGLVAAGTTRRRRK